MKLIFSRRTSFLIEGVLIFIIGGVLYGICEIIFRGFTHPSMIFLGGFCVAVIYFADKKFRPLSIFLRCFMCGVFITSAELVFGSVVNIAFKMEVWNYSTLPFNFLGQICPAFFFVWVILSFPLLIFCPVLEKWFIRCSKRKC